MLRSSMKISFLNLNTLSQISYLMTSSNPCTRKVTCVSLINAVSGSEDSVSDMRAHKMSPVVMSESEQMRSGNRQNHNGS